VGCRRNEIGQYTEARILVVLATLQGKFPALGTLQIGYRVALQIDHFGSRDSHLFQLIHFTNLQIIQDREFNRSIW
jgi:hypothetical protein